MKRLWILSIGLLAARLAWAGKVPNQITYQGTIKELGAPVTGTRSMLFRLTNTDGSVEYWTSGLVDISVAQGLFSTVLTPTGVDWQNVIPYIELSVGPQGQTPKILLPREGITATAYSLISATVVDGSITTAKLDSTVTNYLIPVGMIALFDSKSCPSGWNEVASLRGRTVFGYDPGNTAQFDLDEQGGSLTHSHTISMGGAHAHNLTGSLNNYNFWAFGTQQGSGSGFYSPATNIHTHGVSAAPDHDHGGTTGSFSTLPQYDTKIYCAKS